MRCGLPATRWTRYQTTPATEAPLGETLLLGVVRWLRIVFRLERIQTGCSGWGDVVHVSRHDGHCVYKCGGGEEAVDVPEGVGDGEPSPPICHRRIHVDDAISEPSACAIEL